MGLKRTRLADNEYLVENILAKRTTGPGQVSYLIKWLGYEDEKDNTWEPVSNLGSCRTWVDIFESGVKFGSKNSTVEEIVEDSAAAQENVGSNGGKSRTNLAKTVNPLGDSQSGNSDNSRKAKRRQLVNTSREKEVARRSESASTCLGNNENSENGPAVPILTHHECVVCRKRFTLKDQLADHMKSHLERKPYQCKICVKSFGKVKNLVAHVLKHSGEKPGKGNDQKKSLKKKNKSDQISKTGENTAKKVVCKICGIEFQNQEDLDTHIQRHLDEKAFTCVFCETKFASSGDYEGHILNHIQERPFNCSKCDQSFVRKSYLEMHQRRRHN